MAKDDFAYQSNNKRAKKQGQPEVVNNYGYISNQTIEDVSCHGGDDDSLGQFSSPLALGGTLGSVPDFGKPVGTSSKRKSKKSKKNKSKKSKHSRSRSSRSRSSSSSSSHSVEVPPPKPSVDQVLFYMPNILYFLYPS